MVEPGTGNVKALAQSRPMGSDEEAGPDLPQLRGPPEVRRLRRLPGRLDVQGVRARRRDRAGHPARPDDQLRRRRHDPDEADFATCHGEPLRLPTPGRPQLHQRRHDEPLHRHPAVGEHLLRPARGADRALRAVTGWPKRMGVEPSTRQAGHRERVPSFTLGVADVEPAGDGRGLRHVRRPRPALRLAAGDRDRRLQRAAAQGLPRAVPAGDAAPTSPTPSTTCCAACRSPAASATTPASA